MTGKPIVAGEDLEVTFPLKKNTPEVNRHVMVWYQVVRDEEVVFTGNSELFDWFPSNGQDIG